MTFTKMIADEKYYHPTQNFLRWLKINKPSAYYYFEANAPVLLSASNNRWRIRIPDSAIDVLTENERRDFDRQVDCRELCLVLDAHPDSLKLCD